MQKQKKNLKEHPEIILTKADNISVLVNQSDYETKISNLLSAYEIMKRHSTEILQRKINALIESWRNKQYIKDAVTKKKLNRITVQCLKCIDFQKFIK
jgi:hypothetical protein